jgi:hypothetical protein
MPELISPYHIAKEIINDLRENPDRYRLNVRSRKSPLVVTYWHIANYLREKGIYLPDERLGQLIPHVMRYIHDILITNEYKVEKKSTGRRMKLIIYVNGD